MRPTLAGIVRSLLLLAIVVAGAGWAAPTPAQATPSDQANGQVHGLSLVYLDTSKPQTTEVWVTSLDGAAKRMVTAFGADTRAVGLAGSRLALISDVDLVALDLADGSSKRTTLTNRFANGYLAPDGTAFFATRAGCGGEELKTILGRLDATTGERSDIATLELAGARILWHDAAANEVIISPTGCDPGIWSIQRLDATTGTQKSDTEVRGCGWSAVAPSGQQALVGTTFCTSPDQAELSVYDLQDGSHRGVTFSKDAPSEHAFVYAPDGTHAAYGIALARGARGVAPTSGGIWLLDAATLRSALLWQDKGLESWAIDWSPDGAKLVVASVEAQERCGYYVVDVASRQAAQVDGVSECGTNGGMIGFATLP